MSRDIKFRAWHKKTKYMCQKVETDLLDRDYLEFMQYTGIKDNEGKEIYEADLLEDIEHQLYVVEFYEGAFIAVNVFIPGSRTIKNDLVKVGNIYENPNLLEDVANE